MLSAIYRGQIRAGDRLIVARLAQQFGVSATPAREALLELTALGMVDMLPNRGAVVRPFGPKQLADLYQVRRVLEAEATRCACGRIDRAALTALLEEMQALAAAKPSGNKWSTRAIAADRRLHALLAEHCDNQRLADDLRRYDALVQVAREMIDNHQRAQQAAVAEHLEILAALLANDPIRAAGAMARHIESAAAVIHNELFGAGLEQP
jgi:DNA-binding GntR family transcriptional regulator